MYLYTLVIVWMCANPECKRVHAKAFDTMLSKVIDDDTMIADQDDATMDTLCEDLGIVRENVIALHVVPKTEPLFLCERVNTATHEILLGESHSFTRRMLS